MPRISTENGDIRVDLPIWFGDPSSKMKIVILGLEPRDSDKSGQLNIEKVNKYVFGTPFALERNYSRYSATFKDFFDKENLFLYFTDIVKTYGVNNHSNKIEDDKIARKNFKVRAEKGKDFLLAEINLIKPDIAIALGGESHKFLTKNGFFENFNLIKVRHPSFGGSKIAKEQLHNIIAKLDQQHAVLANA